MTLSHMHLPRRAALAVSLFLLLPAPFRGSPVVKANDGVDFFEQRIRPVLIEHCYECHSADAVKRDELQGGLRLDSRPAARAGGDTGAAVVPGDVESSLLIGALRYQSGLEMPPAGKLPDHVVADFAMWIEMGAPDPRTQDSPTVGPDAAANKPEADTTHWAYQPPRLHPRPAVKNSQWPRTDWDFFILARLERRGLGPAKPATKRELIRRVTFDLTGLPPRVADVDAFLDDDSAGAWQKVVDRLLASPHHGERWGRHWLDVARYADDKALAYHNPWPHAYVYRDWVVGALNDDMPYDRFVRLQLAGDLLPGPIADYSRRLAGLGFQGLGAFYHKGSVPEQVKADELDDRIDTLSRGLLGLTVACARCHDHKYDPIATEDYYSLAAAYNGAEWTEVKMAPSKQIQAHDAWTKTGEQLEKELQQWRERQGRRAGRRELERLDMYLAAAWKAHVQSPAQDKSLDVADLANRAKLSPVFLRKWMRLLETADLEKAAPELAAWISAARDVDRPGVSDGRSPLTLEPPERLRGATQRLGQRVQAALRARDKALQEDADVDQAAKRDDPRSARPAEDQERLLDAIWLAKDAPFHVSDKEVPDVLDAEQQRQHETLRAKLAEHQSAEPPRPPVTHGVTGGGQAMKVYVRGNVERPGELAPPGFLPVLRCSSTRSPASDTFDRLALADAICDPANPLTARVIVNRVWQHHFGRGIVATASNFGTLGDSPTHPRLLDTLAVRFMESGWSLKWLHRQLVSSAAYQLSSRVDRAAREADGTEADGAEAADDPDPTDNPDPHVIDPQNRLLWRYQPRRLQLESWRDAILSVSGHLDGTLGGPPAGRAEDGHRRRTLYSTISRREPDKMLVTFDFPDANVTSQRRDVTTVPQQQLFTLNSPFMLTAAKAFADQAVQAAEDDRRRLAWMYRRAFSRPPTDQELRFGQDFLKSMAETPTDDQSSGWEQLAHAILASNEFSWID